MGAYITEAELLAEPDVPDDTAAADIQRAIDQAEDQIDDWLGARPRDPATGRLVVEQHVEAWQWSKLKRATVRLAAKLVLNPDLFTPAAYDEIAGPDFRKKGPRSAVAAAGLSDVSLPLNSSGLRVLSARAVP